MAYESNRYCLNTTGKELKTPACDLNNFFGIQLIMGTIRYPKIRMYWDQKYRLPAVADVMTRNRFTKLGQNLHLVDNDTVTDNAKINKFWIVQPMIDSIRNRCLQLPRQVGDYSIDEQMIPFLGACPSRQYVKNKPRPVGLKNFVCTTSCGLVVDFEMYQGKIKPWEESGLRLGANVILHLSKTLPVRSRLHYDRYFSTINLLDALRERGLFGIMANRLGGKVTFPKDNEMDRGEAIQKVRGDGNVCLAKWKDNKGVLMASNIYGVEPIHEVRRWDKKQKQYSNAQIMLECQYCPNVVKIYNEKWGVLIFVTYRWRLIEPLLKPRNGH